MYKGKLKAFRHDQVLICAKNNSKLLQTGYDNQTVIQNGGVHDGTGIPYYKPVPVVKNF